MTHDTTPLLHTEPLIREATDKAKQKMHEQVRSGREEAPPGSHARTRVYHSFPTPLSWSCHGPPFCCHLDVVMTCDVVRPPSRILRAALLLLLLLFSLRACTATSPGRTASWRAAWSASRRRSLAPRLVAAKIQPFWHLHGSPRAV